MPSFEYQVFLSHSNADKPAVEELARRLKQQGIEPWLDKWNLIPGEPWQPAIEKALAACATCAVFIGPSGIGPWQNEEMRAAIDRRVQESGRRFRVIPVLLPGGERGERSRLPTFLVATTWVKFLRSLDDDGALHCLISGIRGHEPGPGPGQAIHEGKCPYRGLEVFDVGHAAFFCGREALTEWLLDKLRPSAHRQEPNRFLAIIGSSGSGKSSLARAGLVAAIQRGEIEGGSQWPIAICRPGHDPLESLATALSTCTTVGQSPTAFQEFIAELQKNENMLHRVTRLALRQSVPECRLVLLVDQFEELFTLVQNEELRKTFIGNLLYAAKVSQGQTVVLLTMRADFYGKCAPYTDLAAALSDHHDLVGPMTEEELRRSIERPAQLVGCEFEPGLVDLLVQEVKNQAGALPLLQDALLELWKRREGRRLTWAAYREMGELHGALEKRANTILMGFNESQRELCRRIFLRLTQPGEGTEDTKRRVPLLELLSSAQESATMEGIVQKLADARLITTEGDARLRRASFVEVAHEALIRSWSELRKWVDADRAGLLTHCRLTETAREWENHDREVSYLYTGAQLAIAEEWADAHPNDLNLLEGEFFGASVKLRDKQRAEEQLRQQRELAQAQTLAKEQQRVAQEQHQRAEAESQRAEEQQRRAEAERLWAEEQKQRAEAERRRAELEQQRAEREKQVAANLRLQLFGSVIALGIMLALAVTAYVFYRRAEAAGAAEAEAHDLERHYLAKMMVEKGVSFLEIGDVSGALLWFTEALRREGNGESRGELHRQRLGIALRQLSRPAQVFWHDRLAYAEASRDGLYVVTVGDGRARLWDAKTGLQVMDTLGDDASPVYAAVFSPDSRRIVFARGKATSDQGKAEVWDLNSKKLIVNLDHEGAVNCATFSNDGSRLAMGSEVANGRRGEALIWDGATYKKLQSLPHERGGVTWVGFSYDGKRLATGSQEPKGDGGEVLVWQVQTDGPAPLALLSSIGLGALPPGQGPVLVASALAPVRSERLVMSGLHRKGVSFAAFCPPEGRLLVSVSGEAGEAKVWNVESGQTVLIPDHKGPLTNADFSPDGGLLVTTSLDGAAKVWEVIDGSRIPPLPLLTLEHGSSVFHASFTPGGRFLITSSRDQAARIWELATGKLLVPPLSHNGTVSSARFSSDARQVLTVGPDTAEIWEVATRNPILPIVRAGDSVNYAALSPDAQLLVTASGERGSEAGVAEIWDVHTGQSRVRVELKGAVTYAAFNFDSSQLVTVCQPAKGGKSSVQVWQLAGPKMVMVREPSTDKWPGKGAVTCSAFSHDGQRVALASELDDPAGKNGEVWIWNIANDDFTRCAPEGGKPAHDEPVTSVALNPHDSRLATTSTDDTARLWDAATGELRATLKHTAEVSHAIFSPDGRLVITVGTDRKAKVWPAEIVTSSGQRAEPAAVLNHSSYLNHAAFSPDGQRIATAAQDGTVRVWDVESKELIAILRHRGNVRHTAFSPAGDQVLATSYDVPTQIRARDWPAGMDVARGQVHTRLWGLADFAQSSITDLELYAQVLSALKYDPNAGNVVPIEGKELEELWRKLKNDPREFPFGRPISDPRAPEEITWHKRRAAECEAAREWFAAAWHLTQLLDVQAEKAPLLARRAEAFSRLPGWRGKANSGYSEALKLAPQDWQLWAGRADTFYYLSQWDQAVQDYTKAIELKPENAYLWESRAQTYAVLRRWNEAAADSSRAIELDPKKWVPWSTRAQALAELGDQDKARRDYAKAIELGADQAGVWYALALLHLAKNDRQDYRDLCKQMLARFASAEDPATANDVAWTCALDPESVSDWSQPLRLVEKAVAGVSEPQATYYYLNTLGAVLYRAGDTSAALKRLQEAMSASPGKQGTAWEWLFLAMAHHRLGHANEARKCLDEALKGSAEDTYSSWAHRLELALLRKEAQALLGGKS